MRATSRPEGNGPGMVRPMIPPIAAVEHRDLEGLEALEHDTSWTCMRCWCEPTIVRHDGSRVRL